MRRALLLVAGFGFLSAAASAQDIYVSNSTKSDSPSVNRFNGTTGTFVSQIYPLAQVQGLAFSAGGDLFVNDAGTTRSYSGTTNAPLGSFSTGIDLRDLAFGPNGDVYGVVNQASKFANRYNTTTGALVTPYNVSPPGSVGGVPLPGQAGEGTVAEVSSITLLPDGDLLVGYFQPAFGVRRYDGTTGAGEGQFIAGVSGNFLTLGTGGDVFVSDGTQVLRFDGTTGAAEGVFATAPSGFFADLTFGTGGDLFGVNGSNVSRFDGTSGAFEGVFTNGFAFDGP